MANLTLSIDDNLIVQARVRSIQQGTSLSAKVRDLLRIYVDTPETDHQQQREAAAKQLLATMDAVNQTSATRKISTANRKSKHSLRDDLYNGDFRTRDRIV